MTRISITEGCLHSTKHWSVFWIAGSVLTTLSIYYNSLYITPYTQTHSTLYVTCRAHFIPHTQNALHPTNGAHSTPHFKHTLYHTHSPPYIYITCSDAGVVHFTVTQKTNCYHLCTSQRAGKCTRHIPPVLISHAPQQLLYHTQTTCTQMYNKPRKCVKLHTKVGRISERILLRHLPSPAIICVAICVYFPSLWFLVRLRCWYWLLFT